MIARPQDVVHFQGTECEGCGGEFAANALDENDWCDACRLIMKRRLARGRHIIAALITLPFAIWVLTLDRGGTLAQPVWLLPLAAAYYLGLRIGREVVRGYSRWKSVTRSPR